MAHQPLQWTKALSLSRIHYHTQTHHTLWDSSERVISPTQIPLPNNTLHSQQTNIHAPAGIRTYNPRKREAADLRLRLRGHWDRPLLSLEHKMFSHIGFCVRSNAQSDILGVMDRYSCVILFVCTYMPRDITTQTLGVLY
jgi:hypothetical protein